jgi:hypothetical protein
MCFIGYWWDVRLNFVRQFKFYVLNKNLKKEKEPKNDLFFNCRTKSKELSNKLLSNIPTSLVLFATEQSGVE